MAELALFLDVAIFKDLESKTMTPYMAPEKLRKRCSAGSGGLLAATY